MVVTDLYIDRPMQLDTCQFCAGIPLMDMYVVDAIVANFAENGPEAAYDACLPTIENDVVTNDMMANRLFVPTIVESSVDRAYITFGGFSFVVPLVAVFP